jgi:hypothetical protein
MSKINKILLLILRKLMPDILAADICSVQPMSIDYTSVDQISNLVFEYPPWTRPEIRDWLYETTHYHEITKGAYKPRVIFKEAQGAVEFKLRFHENSVKNLKTGSIFTIQK